MKTKEATQLSIDTLSL